MAKATVDGTIPCSKCGDTVTVENQKWTGGPDREREVYVKCLRCQAETPIGVFRFYGNSLLNVEDLKYINDSSRVSSASRNSSGSFDKSSSSSGTGSRGCQIACLVLLASLVLIGILTVIFLVALGAFMRNSIATSQRAVYTNSLTLPAAPVNTSDVNDPGTWST